MSKEVLIEFDNGWLHISSETSLDIKTNCLELIPNLPYQLVRDDECEKIYQVRE